jgi:hypothetical protein
MKNQNSVKTKDDNINIKAKKKLTLINETTAINSPIKFNVRGNDKLNNKRNNRIILD